MTQAAEQLARVEFAVTAGIHFLFAALTLGLLPIVAVCQTRWTMTGRAHLERMTKFWGNLYLINYALGIVTGLVMEFQFGLNWGGLSETAGNVFGAPLALETLVAFFAEATFIGLWILGWGRLPKWVHLSLIWLVTLAAYASAYWVMVANGFQQHPVGYAVHEGRLVLTDWRALLVNQGMTYGLAHLLTAALTVAGFFMAGVSAYHLLRATAQGAFFRRSLWTGLIVGGVTSVATVGLGFAQYGYLRSAQPAKLATITGDAVGRARAAGHGLPPARIETAQQAMIGIGIALVAVALGAMLFRDRVVGVRPFLWTLVALIPLPYAGLIAGWLVREVGRQPWAVYGLLRTSAAGGRVGAADVAFSLVAFTIVYAGLAVLDYLLLARAARRGPHDGLFAAAPAEEPADGRAVF